MKYSDFLDLKYKPGSSDVICLFRISPARGLSLREAASRVASESSNGTWSVLHPPAQIRELSARCFSIKGNLVKIAYPLELFELGNMPQILSSIAGNIFGMKAVAGLRLEDIRWPKQLLRSFEGPQFGISGVRKILRIRKRPITATVPKPKVGYYPEEHAKVGYQAWLGGVDLLKDDENLSSQNFNKFEKRLKLCMSYRDKAERETGERKSYLLNITAETNEMLRRAQLASDYGNEYVMVDILTAGWAAVQTIRDACKDLGLAIHAHRAFHAAFDRNLNHGMSMKVLAEIARIQGVDQLHIGAMGKLAGTKTEVYNNWQKLARPGNAASGALLHQYWHGMKPALPVCSGGLHPGIIGRLFDLLGADMAVQLGGGIHGHPDGTRAGAKALRDAIDAYLAGTILSEKAKTSPELKKALDTWGHKTPV